MNKLVKYGEKIRVFKNLYAYVYSVLVLFKNNCLKIVFFSMTQKTSLNFASHLKLLCCKLFNIPINPSVCLLDNNQIKFLLHMKEWALMGCETRRTLSMREIRYLSGIRINFSKTVLVRCGVERERKQGQSEQVKPIFQWVWHMNQRSASPTLQLSRVVQWDSTHILSYHILAKLTSSINHTS